jgi:hypothetical protein
MQRDRAPELSAGRINRAGTARLEEVHLKREAPIDETDAHVPSPPPVERREAEPAARRKQQGVALCVCVGSGDHKIVGGRSQLRNVGDRIHDPTRQIRPP